jgi:uncharacterized DUF497 family protein
MRIDELHWTDDNVGHLWAAHRITPDEIEEIIFGVDGEAAVYRLRRDGPFYIISGETGSGRLVKIVGEFLGEGIFRVFAARDMKPQELRTYRKGK